jgi:hypothetical protein
MEILVRALYLSQLIKFSRLLRTKAHPTGRLRGHGQLDLPVLDGPVDRHAVGGVVECREKGVSFIRRGVLLEPRSVLVGGVGCCTKVCGGRRGAHADTLGQETEEGRDGRKLHFAVL